MIFNSKFVRAAGVLCLLFSLSVAAFADTIRLKDGSIIKGKIVGFANGSFTVAVGDGARARQMTFAAGDIESIQFDAPQMPAANTGNQTAAGNSNTKIITVGQTTRNPDEPVVAPKVITTENNRPANTTTVENTRPSNTNTAAETRTANTASVPAANTSQTSGGGSRPIALNFKVLADNTANGWTNSGWVVKKGQRIRIVGDGRVSLGNGRFSTASGISSLPDNDKLMKAVATGALIAVIGDDNNNFIYVGMEREFVAERDGALFLGVNEGNLEDNSGAFEVKVEIDPNSGK